MKTSCMELAEGGFEKQSWHKSLSFTQIRLHKFILATYLLKNNLQICL